ncbi:MAG: hypothetical protein IPM47_14440 [Sphingobacteriales bacterium]|nr:MAG: hypothetical protein IPM47_14440 [Sphingobacteriales bacterium]
MNSRQERNSPYSSPVRFSKPYRSGYRKSGYLRKKNLHHLLKTEKQEKKNQRHLRKTEQQEKKNQRHLRKNEQQEKFLVSSCSGDSVQIKLRFNPA